MVSVVIRVEEEGCGLRAGGGGNMVEGGGLRIGGEGAERRSEKVGSRWRLMDVDREMMKIQVCRQRKCRYIEMWYGSSQFEMMMSSVWPKQSDSVCRRLRSQSDQFNWETEWL